MSEQKSNTDHESDDQPARLSAPELPAHIAKEYGLHHLTVKSGGVPSGAGASGRDAQAAASNGDNDDDAGVSPVVNDAKTDAAVDDIIAKEADEMLAIQDASDGGAVVPGDKRPGFWRRIGRALKFWVTNPWTRWATIIVIFSGVVVVVLVPGARYFVLNSAGVRSSARIKVLDNGTQLPLKNVSVTIGGQTARTDIDGEASIPNIRLGEQQLTVKRIAFAPLNRKVTVGWGSNPLGTVALKSTGLQYKINVLDYVSGRPLAGAEAVNSEDGINALSDGKGVISLMVSDTDPKELAVTITKNGYRSEKLALSPEHPEAASVKLVPSAKTFYISNASGKYDLYASDIDGQGKKVILSGTGNESQNFALAASPSGEWVAYVSTRDGARSKDNYLLRGITLVRSDGGTAMTLERAEQIRLIDWVGSRIIYQVTVASASAANSQRNRLIAYDYAANSRVQLATANNFSGVHSIGGTLYYAVAGADPSAGAAFMKIRPDGTGRQVILKKEVWAVFRTSHAGLALQTPDGWYGYAAGAEARMITEAPAAINRYYADSPDGSKTATAETRDGKGTIITSSANGAADKVVAAKDGLTNPVRWLNNTTLVFRVVTADETADYAVSTLGGDARKVTDLVNAFGYSPL